jgi:hypothetical protein
MHNHPPFQHRCRRVILANLSLGALVALTAAVRPASAQVLIDRYSFNDAATGVVDGEGGRDGLLTNTGGGAAPTESGGVVALSGSVSNGGQVVLLPTNFVQGLTNATFELYTTNYTAQSNYAALYEFGNAVGAGISGSYTVFSPDRAGTPQPVGIGTKVNGAAETIVSGASYPAGATTHVTDVVYSGFGSVGNPGSGTIGIYLDGTQIASGTTSYSLASIGQTLVNGLGGGGQFNDPTLNGTISEFRVYNGALSQTQIATNIAAGADANPYVTPVVDLNYGPKPGETTAALPAAGAVPGTGVYDGAGSGLHGSLSNSPTYTVYAPTAGTSQDGSSINTQNGYVYFADDTTGKLSLNSNFSIYDRFSLVALPTAGNYATLVGRPNLGVGPYNYDSFVDSAGNLYLNFVAGAALSSASPNNILVATGIQTGQFYDLAFSFAGSANNTSSDTITAYLNGVQVAQATNYNGNFGTSDILHVGSLGGGYSEANANFDRVAYYSQVVSGSQFQTMSLASGALSAPEPGACGLLALGALPILGGIVRRRFRAA